MNGIKINDNENIYPVDAKSVYLDNLNMRYTGGRNNYIVFNTPFPRNERLKVTLSFINYSGGFKLYVLSKEGNTLTIVDKLEYSSSQLKELLTVKDFEGKTFKDKYSDSSEVLYKEYSFEIEMRENHYLGYIGNVASNIMDGIQKDYINTSAVWESLTLSNNTFDISTAELKYRDVAIRIESVQNDYSKRILRGVNGFLNYPEETYGWHFFRVVANKARPDFDNVTTNSVVDSENIVMRDACIHLPKSYTPTGRPTPVIIWCHGWGKIIGSSPSLCTKLSEKCMIPESKGYAVLDVSAYNTMGSPFSVYTYEAAWRYVKEHFNVEDKCYVVGESMGGLSSLNFVNHFRNEVKAVAELFPCIDLKTQAFENDFSGSQIGNAKAVATSYGFDDTTGKTWESDKVRGWNPMDFNTIVIDDKRYTYFDTPLFIIHGLADSTVSIEGSIAYVEAIRNTGNDVLFHQVTGVGHSNTYMMYHEICMFFDRYR